MGGGRRRNWEAVARYVTRRKAGVVLCLSVRVSRPVSACGYGVAGGMGEVCTNLWAGRSESPQLSSAGLSAGIVHSLSTGTAGARPRPAQPFPASAFSPAPQFPGLALPVWPLSRRLASPSR